MRLKGFSLSIVGIVVKLNTEERVLSGHEQHVHTDELAGGDVDGVSGFALGV